MFGLLRQGSIVALRRVFSFPFTILKPKERRTVIRCNVNRYYRTGAIVSLSKSDTNNGYIMD